MRFVAQRENLLKPLHLLSGVVEKRQTMPILSNVLIRIEDDNRTMTASDGEIEVVVNIDIENDVGGVVTVPLRRFYDSCRSLPESAQIHFEDKKDKSEIKSGKTRFSLVTLPAGNFPKMETRNPTAEYHVTQSNLKELIEKTQFAMAIQDVRYFLNGMLFEFDNGYLNAVATDGHRLAFARRKLSQPSDVKTSVIVPRKAVIELSKMFDANDELVSIYVGDNYLRFKFSKLVFTTKLIDGSYPNYQAVIPVAGSRVCLAEKNALKDCFQRTAVLSSEKYRGIKVVLDNNRMKTIANNPEQEEAEDEIEVEFKGEKLEAGFNVNYLIEAVSGISGNKVKIVFAEGSNSAIVKEESGEDTLYVVMPMRL